MSHPKLSPALALALIPQEWGVFESSVPILLKVHKCGLYCALNVSTCSNGGGGARLGRHELVAPPRSLDKLIAEMRSASQMISINKVYMPLLLALLCVRFARR